MSDPMEMEYLTVYGDLSAMLYSGELVDITEFVQDGVRETGEDAIWKAIYDNKSATFESFFTSAPVIGEIPRDISLAYEGFSLTCMFRLYCD